MFRGGRTSNSMMDVLMVSHFKYDTLLEKFVGYRVNRKLSF